MGDNTINGPRVEGINLVAFQGHGIDLNRAATRVGTYSFGSIGCNGSHDVFDLPASSLRPFIRDQLSDNVASNQDGSIIRLYVPRSYNGQINEIGMLNDQFNAPGAPFVPRSGGKIYVAPNSDNKYKSRGETRPPKTEFKSWGDPNWRPSPGDRFHVTEI